MNAAIEWIAKTAGTGAYANVDASKIMAAGFSCGGTEAMEVIWNSKVDTVGVISSGLLNNQTAAKAWKKPVLFVLGGSGDIAYANVSSLSTLYKVAIETLTSIPGRARLQEPFTRYSFLEGQHSRRPWWYIGRCQWRNFWQSNPELVAVDFQE